MNRTHFTAQLALCAWLLAHCFAMALAEDPPTAAAAVLTSTNPNVFAPDHSAIELGRFQLAIVIDDLGYNRARDMRAIELPAALTVAVLPQSPWAAAMASHAARAGKEVILHQPMQTLSGRHLHEHGGLRLGMTAPDYAATLSANLAAVPGSVGINNHRGSLLTAELDAMTELMQQLQNRGLYFLDSRTTAATVAHDVAKHWGVPTLKRDVFLDHERTAQALDHEFKRALKIARKQGYAVLIAHPHEISLDYLSTALAQLPGDIETTTLSALIARQASATFQANEPASVTTAAEF
ncbi:MAG: divergent polysaccharide deacetylase family protein [Pseudomonadales bacterium]